MISVCKNPGDCVLTLLESAGYAQKEIATGSIARLRQQMGPERFGEVLKEANMELPPLTRERRKATSHKKLVK